jgi:outer membrane protein TolC
MKNSIPLLLLIIPLTIYSKDLSKKEILQYAFTHAEEFHLIKNEMASAQSVVKEYRGKGFPTIEASVNYQLTPKQFMPYSFDMSGGSGASISSYLDQSQPWSDNDATIAGALDQMVSSFSEIDLTPAKNTVAMELSVMQPIYAQGKISKGLKIAKMYMGSLDLKYKNTQFSLSKDIINAYNGALLADQNKKVQSQAVALAQETHRLTRARLESGKGNVLDTLNSMFSLQQAKFALRDAEKNRHMAVKKLLTLASMDGDPYEIILTDSLTVIDFTITEDEAVKRLS